MRRDANHHRAVIGGPSDVDGIRNTVDFSIDHDHNGITIRPSGPRMSDRACEAIASIALMAMDRCPVEKDGTIIIDVSDIERLPGAAPRVFARIASEAAAAGYRPAFYGARAIVMDQIRIFGIDRSYRLHFPGGSPRAA